MSYQAAQQQQQNNAATRADRSAMQPFAATAAAMPMISLKTDQLLGLFLLIAVIVINMLLLSGGSGGG